MKLMGSKEKIIQAYDQIIWEKFFALARDIQTQNDYNFENEELMFSALSVRGSKLSSEEFERLEYLGDSIYGALVGLILFNKFKQFSPKELTNYRSKVAQNSYLSKLSSKLSLERIGSILQIGDLSDGQLADLFEAYVGAIFRDTGSDFNKTMDIISSMIDFDELSEQVSDKPWKDRDVKGYLINQIQKQYGNKFKPLYSLEQSGPQNAPDFVGTLAIQNIDTGEILEKPRIISGKNNSKKNAEKECALNLLLQWEKEGKLIE